MHSLVIVGRRWRDSNGNTYHTSEIAIDTLYDENGNDLAHIYRIS